MTKKTILNTLLKTSIIMLSAIVYAFFFKVIVEGRGFYAMGASGFAVILSRLVGTWMSKEDLVSVLYMIFYICINIPIAIFGYFKISKKFIVYTVLYVITFSVTVGFIPASLGTTLGFSELDNLTGAILIGIISGVSCAIAMKAGGCAGGLDVIATYLNEKKGKSIGIYNLLFNAVVLTIALIAFKSVSSIVYTLVYAFVSSIVLDRYYSRTKKVFLEIVTKKREEVAAYLMEHSHHGCTIFEAKGAYTKDEKEVIHTVLSWSQLREMTKAIKEIDPSSFIIELDAVNVNGKFYMAPRK